MYKIYLALITCLIFLPLGPPGMKAEKAYTPPVNCLRLYWENDIWFNNPDSIMVDICTNSPTNGEYYAKQFFWVQFKYNVLPRLFKTTNYDTIVEYSWQDIDPIYNETRIGFNQIEKKYGKFWLRETQLWLPDTANNWKRLLKVYFEDIQNIDSIVSSLSFITYIHDDGYAWRAYAGISDKINNRNDILVYPNPSDNKIDVLIPDKFCLLNENLIEIFSNAGHKIREFKISYHNEITLDVADLLPGLYFLKVNSIFKPFIIDR